MDNELDPYPGNLKRHVVEPAKPKFDQDAFLRNLDKAKAEPLLSDASIIHRSICAVNGAILEETSFLTGSYETRDFYERARTKDTSLLREGEQYMQHKKGCEYGKIHWTRSERSRFEMHRNMNCTCGLDAWRARVQAR